MLLGSAPGRSARAARRSRPRLATSVEPGARQQSRGPRRAASSRWQRRTCRSARAAAAGVDRLVVERHVQDPRPSRRWLVRVDGQRARSRGGGTGCAPTAPLGRRRGRGSRASGAKASNASQPPGSSAARHAAQEARAAPRRSTGAGCCGTRPREHEAGGEGELAQVAAHQQRAAPRRAAPAGRGARPPAPASRARDRRPTTTCPSRSSGSMSRPVPQPRSSTGPAALVGEHAGRSARRRAAAGTPSRRGRRLRRARAPPPIVLALRRSRANLEVGS